MAGLGLLPRRATDFAEAGYWERFFRARGGRAFEWYREWEELRGPLARYLRPPDPKSKKTPKPSSDSKKEKEKASFAQSSSEADPVRAGIEAFGSHRAQYPPSVCFTSSYAHSTGL